MKTRDNCNDSAAISKIDQSGLGIIMMSVLLAMKRIQVTVAVEPAPAVSLYHSINLN